MTEFLTETMKANTFWTALSSIGTIGAVLVALFLPTISNYKKYINMKKAIDMEFSENCAILGKIENWKETQFINGKNIPTGYMTNIAYLRELNLSFWNKYKFEVSLRDIDTYNDLKPYINYFEKIRIILDNENQHAILPNFCNDFIEDLKKSKFKDNL